MPPFLFVTISLLVSGPLGCWAEVWWKNNVIYQVYPQSFYDYDGDGMGDMKGIEAKASYLGELGVGAIWINPFYKSPKIDNGYDISDYRKIDPAYGTMQDFENMLNTLKNKYSIKVIMDFVPNHTSDQHEWFQKSIKRIDPYTDYYLWADPKGTDDHGNPIPPNNWWSVLGGGSGWQWNDARKQFYYHAFFPQQPDLNFRCPHVMEELKQIMLFWLGKGVMGFRIDAVPWIFEDEELRDNPGYNPLYTQNLPETYEVIYDFRAFLDEYSAKNNVNVFLTAEVFASPEETLRYYGTQEKPGAHFPFNFVLANQVDINTNAHGLNNTIIEYLNNLQGDYYPNWVSDCHDLPRMISRMGAPSTADVVNILNLLLPGSATVYMGDEIGMDSYWAYDRTKCITPKVAQDYRTPHRTPFHWNDEKNAGFTTSDKPWVPVNPDYYRTNVASERGAPCALGKTTHLRNFKKMMHLKKYPAFTRGKLATFVLGDFLFAFSRTYGKSMFLIIINLERSQSAPININKSFPETKNTIFMGIEVKSVNVIRDLSSSHIFSESFSLPPQSAVVLSFRFVPNVRVPRIEPARNRPPK